MHIIDDILCNWLNFFFKKNTQVKIQKLSI